uniref:Uncharacterized protein n=1 Tax=Lutzomyia longipalpis TaxID=7200 RepID=A0A1B0CI32_LUTLO
MALRDSLVVCSKPLRMAQQLSSSGESVVHLSTARLNLAAIKQQSEASEVSSFEHALPNGRMACENLLKLDDSMPLCSNLKPRNPIEERHSMPTLFVGNRFNNSSPTEIYIPSWRDRQTGGGTEETRMKAKHSTSIELPQVSLVQLPDQVAAEIMYNLHGDGDSGEVIVKPPSMFRGGSCDGAAVLLSREVSPFAKHSINSDLRMSVNKERRERRSVRRCLYDSTIAGATKNQRIARCCDRRELRHSRSSHNLGRYPHVSVAASKVEEDLTDSGQYGDSGLLKDDEMSPPPSLGGSHQSRVTTPIHMSQHKRSHSFNHHLTFNQLQKQQQAQPQHPHPAPPLPPSHHPIQPKDITNQSLVVQNEKSVNPKATI